MPGRAPDQELGEPDFMLDFLVQLWFDTDLDRRLKEPSNREKEAI